MQVKHKIDYAGALPLTLALGSLVLISSFGGRTFGWTSPEMLGMIGLCAMSSVLFMIVEARATEPVLPLHLFKNNVF